MKCQCGLEIHPASHISDFHSLGSFCGAHLHPVWAEDCVNRYVANLEAVIEAADAMKKQMICNCGECASVKHDYDTARSKIK